MRRYGRILALLALAAPFLLYAALRLGLWTPLLNLALSVTLKDLTPVQVRLGSLRTDIVSFVEADDVVVLAPLSGSKLPLVTVANLRLEYRGWAAWRGRVDYSEALTLARIRGLSVFMLRQADGAWNLSVLGGRKKDEREEGKGPGLPLLPAGRVELEGAQLVLNDEAEGFHTSVDGLQGSLDTRALPLIAFTLNGRTEGKNREDLSVAGEWDRRDGSLRGRLDLASVPMARYLNYLLPSKGLRFESGSASLSVRLRRQGSGPLSAAGRAEISDGALRLPGIAQPLSGLQGAIAFDPERLRFRNVSARFLDSDWTASGSIEDLAAPRFDIQLSNPSFPLQALSAQVAGMGQLALTGTATVEASLSGPAVKPVVQAHIQAPVLGIFGVELQAVSAGARLQGSRLEVSALDGRLWGGSMHGRASMGLGRGGKLDAQVAVSGASLVEARIKGRRPLPLSGTAAMRLSAQGLLRDPQVAMDLSLADSSLGALPLGAMKVDAAWGPQGLRSSFDGAQGRLTGGISFKRGADAEFESSSIRLQGLDLASLAEGLATAGESIVLPPSGVAAGAWLRGRMGGSIRAQIAFEGAVRSPAIWIDAGLGQGRFFLQDGVFQLREKKQGVPLGLRGEIGFQGGEVRFGRQGRPLRISLERRGRGLEALLLGRYPLRNSAAPGKLELAVDGDLRVLESLRIFKDTQGRLKADLMLGGTLDAPEARGELAITGFKSKVEGYLAPVRDGELKILFEGQRFELARLSLRSGGQLEANGALDLSAGLKGMQGRLNIGTDAEGLRIQDWEGMGSANLVLDPLVLATEGEGQPWRLSGRFRLANALIVYAGRKKSAAAEAPAAAPGRPWEVDLELGLGPNVWYEKKAEGVEIFDLKGLASGAINSLKDTFQRPDVFFRLRPTEQDLRIRRKDGETNLSGTLSIDRGRLTIMDNDFEIRDDLQAIESVGPRVSLSGHSSEGARSQAGPGGSMIRFSGRRADVYATAISRMRYIRNDRLSGRPQQRSVNVIVYVSPMDLDQLERAGLADAFLNYSIEFGADALIEKDAIPAHRQGEAILNMVVLGDPLLDLQLQAELAGGQSSDARLVDSQINRLLSGEVKRQISKWSKRGFKFLGGPVLDVLRVVPRFTYQNSNRNQAAPAASGAGAQADESTFIFNDLTIELGKSLTERLYASAQYVRFGENGLNGATSGGTGAVTGLESQQAVRDYGWRTGLEYQLSPNRTAELYYSYSLDDNMLPLVYNPSDLSTAHAAGVRLRNTIPTENYTPRLARERRWGVTQGARP